MGRTCVTPCYSTGYPLEKGKSQKIGPKPALFKAPKGPELETEFTKERIFVKQELFCE